MYYLDSHCHLGFYKSELPQILANCWQKNIKGFVLAGTEPDDWLQQLEIKETHGKFQIVPVFGIHPWWADKARLEDYLDSLKTLIEQCQGLGEIGLDFIRAKGKAEQQIQIECFEAQLPLACLHQLPVVLHIVKAHHIALPILKAFPNIKGIVHSFSGSKELAKSYLDLGYCLSLGRLHPRSISAAKVAMINSIPDERLLIESDSPSSAETSSPLEIITTAGQLAKIRNQTAEDLLTNSRRNILRLFNINPLVLA